MNRMEVAYLDRDGTINIDRHYLADPDAFEFCPGAIEGLKRMSDMGLDLVVITNQSGIARGLIEWEALHSIHTRMTALLGEQGIEVAGIYVCPHGPDDGCKCRKPLPGLIQQAEHDLGRRHGVMVGDKPSDVEAGQAAGLCTIGLFDEAQSDKMERPPDHMARTLADVADWIETHRGTAQ